MSMSMTRDQVMVWANKENNSLAESNDCVITCCITDYVLLLKLQVIRALPWYYVR